MAFRWEDGEHEAMYEGLPEYLRIEINRYIQELEELRTLDPDEYAMFNDEGEVE